MDGSHSRAADTAIGPVACRACDLYEVCSLIEALPVASGLQRCPTLRTVARGEPLYRAGGTAEHVFAIRKGVVKSTAPSGDGQNRVVALHVPGEVLGRESIVRGRYTHDAIAVTPAMVCELPLQPYLRSNEALVPLRAGFEHLRVAPQAGKMRMRGRVRERLERFVADLRTRLQSHGIDAQLCAFELRKRELAELLGVHSQSLGRVVEEMQPDESIRLRGHYVVLQKVA